MELDSEHLTRKICNFEVADAKPTLTDDVAKRFSLLFPHDSAWHATVCRINARAPGPKGNGPSSNRHYEASHGGILPSWRAAPRDRCA
jgi:hypothetical protein